MSYTFNQKSGPILIDAQLSGPTKVRHVKLLLDRGATTSTINVSVLRSVGYDPAQATEFVQMTTGTNVTKVPRTMLNRMSALGQHRIGARAIAFDLPVSANVDGLLGLDFLRNQTLTIDFRAGIITLA